MHSASGVEGAGLLVGIGTFSDLLGDVDEPMQIGDGMTRDVLTISEPSAIHPVARMTRNHPIRHVVVTHEKGIAGSVTGMSRGPLWLPGFARGMASRQLRPRSTRSPVDFI